jgi:hypothetical protein
VCGRAAVDDADARAYRPIAASSIPLAVVVVVVVVASAWDLRSNTKRFEQRLIKSGGGCGGGGYMSKHCLGRLGWADEGERRLGSNGPVCGRYWWWLNFIRGVDMT